MYSNLTPLILQQAAMAVGAPIPKEKITNRDDWRRSHKFKTINRDGESVTMLPSDTYFLPAGRDVWSPFTPDGRLKNDADMAELAQRLRNGNWDDYIIRDERGQVIATTEDFHGRMVINLDKPYSGIRVDDKGVYFGSGTTVENIGAGVIHKDGYMPFPVNPNNPNAEHNYILEINAHSSASGIKVEHTSENRNLEIRVLSSGPVEVDFAPKAANTHVTVRQDKPEELERVQHKVNISSKFAKDVKVEDINDTSGNKRTVTFNGSSATKPAKLTINTTVARSGDDSKTHGVEFLVHDKVGNDSTGYNHVTPYHFTSDHMTSEREFAAQLEKMGKTVEAKAAEIRRKQTETTLPLPREAAPMPMKSGMQR